MIDLEGGRVLHRIRHFYGDRPLMVAGHSLFGNLQDWSYFRNQSVIGEPLTPSLAATGDGKHFFFGSGQVWRFRIEGEDLVYEEGACEAGGMDVPAMCVLSADDRFALVRGRTVVDPLRLSEVKGELRAPFEGAGIDGKRGCVYVGCRDGGGCRVEVYSVRGRKIADLPAPSRSLSLLGPRIAVNPQGGGLAMSLARDRLGYFRSLPGVLPQDGAAESDLRDAPPTK